MTTPDPFRGLQNGLPDTPSAPRPSIPAAWTQEAAQLLREAIHDWPTTFRLALLLAVLGAIVTTAFR
ncbi:hypothetical protein ACWDG1_30325 [Streptomyces sp. NPDC001177]